MFTRKTSFVWIGIIACASMFLMGQGGPWQEIPPPSYATCIHNYPGDGETACESLCPGTVLTDISIPYSEEDQSCLVFSSTNACMVGVSKPDHWAVCCVCAGYEPESSEELQEHLEEEL